MRDLARTLGDLALDMQAQVDTESTLQSMVKGAIDIVPGARWAGISLIDGRTIESRVPTDALVAELDKLQEKLDEGPCLSALREHRTVEIADTRTDDRWPGFNAAAADLGVRSLLAFQLYVVQQNLGALNLYGGQPEVFSDDSRDIGAIVAQHASVALIGAEAETQFESALASRDVIGQAKGIVMERFTIDGGAAFQLLVRLSQDTNVKLIDVARSVVASVGDRN